MSVEDKVRREFEAAGQVHVFRFFEDLLEDDRRNILNRLRRHNPQRLRRLLEQAQTTAGTISEQRIRPPSLVDFDAVHRRATGLAKRRGKESEKCDFGPELLEAFRDVVSESACTVVGKNVAPEELRQAWRRLGLELIVLLAGGDGSRLGFPGPKGALPVGPLSGATLFQLFAERIRRVQLLAERAIKTPERVGDGNLKLNFANQSKEFRGACVPLLVMTSASNHLATKQFFRDHGFFGLKEENVEFFLQGTLPVFDLSGRLILSGPGTLAEAPDGNGGVFEALNRSGALRRMKERGVVGFHVLAVDNALAKPADPTFLGFAVSADAQVANKVVARRSPSESVGIMCQLLSEASDTREGPKLSPRSPENVSREKVDGSRWAGGVVEYSELPEELRSRTVPGGTDSTQLLAFQWGNVCMHFFSLAFVEMVCASSQLEERRFHCARKKVPFWGPTDDKGECTLEECGLQKPEEPNGWKLEQFIFDVFPLASRVVCLEVAREDEFAPIKTARRRFVSKHEDSLRRQRSVEEDTLEAAQQMLSALHSKWIRQESLCGTRLSEDEGTLCEISPLVSYEGEGLENQCPHGTSTKYGVLVSPCGDRECVR